MCEFREATTKDYPGICRLIKNQEELFWVYPEAQYPLTVEQVTALSQTRKELTVAIDKNELIGFANLYDDEKNKAVFIGNVVIDQSQRRRGMGKAMISHMIKVTYLKYNLPEVRISVFSENVPALLLYSGFGFTPYEIEERKNQSGHRVALIHMKMDRSKNMSTEH